VTRLPATYGNGLCTWIRPRPRAPGLPLEGGAIRHGDVEIAPERYATVAVGDGRSPLALAEDPGPGGASARPTGWMTREAEFPARGWQDAGPGLPGRRSGTPPESHKHRGSGVRNPASPRATLGIPRLPRRDVPGTARGMTSPSGSPNRVSHHGVAAGEAPHVSHRENSDIWTASKNSGSMIVIPPTLERNTRRATRAAPRDRRAGRPHVRRQGPTQRRDRVAAIEGHMRCNWQLLSDPNDAIMNESSPRFSRKEGEMRKRRCCSKIRARRYETWPELRAALESGCRVSLVSSPPPPSNTVPTCKRSCPAHPAASLPTSWPSRIPGLASVLNSEVDPREMRREQAERKGKRSSPWSRDLRDSEGQRGRTGGGRVGWSKQTTHEILAGSKRSWERGFGGWELCPVKLRSTLSALKRRGLAPWTELNRAKAENIARRG